MQRKITSPELAPKARSFRLPSILDEEILKIAETSRMNLSDTIRELLARGIEAAKHENL